MPDKVTIKFEGSCFFFSRAILTSMTPNYELYTTIIKCARLIPGFVSGNSPLACGSTPERPTQQETSHSEIQDWSLLLVSMRLLSNCIVRISRTFNASRSCVGTVCGPQ